MQLSAGQGWNETRQPGSSPQQAAMTKAQMIVLLIGAIAILHTSMVPPVSQAGGDVCRYHEFTERGFAFTRLYGVNGGDGVALITEYGMIISLVVIVLLTLSLRRKPDRDNG